MSDTPPFDAIRMRLLALLAPVAAHALRHEVPLARLHELLEMAVVERAHQQKIGWQGVANALHVSVSKAARLSRAHRRAAPLFEDNEPPTLATRIERMLLLRPHTLAKLNQVLPDVSHAQLVRALDQLVEQEQVIRSDGGDQAVFTLRLDPENRPEHLARLDYRQLLRQLAPLLDLDAVELTPLRVLPEDLEELQHTLRRFHIRALEADTVAHELLITLPSAPTP